MPEDEKDVVARVGRGLKLGQGLLRAAAQYVADVATLTKEVVERRKEVAEWSARATRWKRRADALEARLYGGVFRTDGLGFGKRMA